jgi:hypothetical protein
MRRPARIPSWPESLAAGTDRSPFSKRAARPSRSGNVGPHGPRAVPPSPVLRQAACGGRGRHTADYSPIARRSFDPGAGRCSWRRFRAPQAGRPRAREEGKAHKRKGFAAWGDSGVRGQNNVPGRELRGVYGPVWCDHYLEVHATTISTVFWRPRQSWMIRILNCRRVKSMPISSQAAGRIHRRKTLINTMSFPRWICSAGFTYHGSHRQYGAAARLDDEFLAPARMASA